jgi:PTH1 family peptidyl-tRNA hydrolase
MFLIVGLGNPRKEFAGTRHNTGFKVIEKLAKICEIPLERVGYKARYGLGNCDDTEIMLAQPQTFVNLSGQSVKALLEYLELTSSQLLVVHDDLDLPLGEIRIKRFGGSGGHNGLNSITRNLGTNKYARVRVGIGRPPGKQDPAKFVLSPFTKKEKEIVKEAIGLAAEASFAVATEGLTRAMNKYNRKAKEEQKEKVS